MGSPLSKNWLRFVILPGLFIAWFVSLLSVYLPISGWISTTVPGTIADQYKIIIFLTLTASASTTFLLAGIYESYDVIP